MSRRSSQANTPESTLPDITIEIMRAAGLDARQQAIIAPMMGSAITLRKRKIIREEFRDIYKMDAERWVMECIDWSRVPGTSGPTPYQRRALRHIIEDKRVAMVGPHGLGKTAWNSWLFHWFISTRDGFDNWKALTTAGSWKQLTAFLWPEIRLWSRFIKWDIIGRAPYDHTSELLQLRFNGGTGLAEAIAPTDPTVIEGAHATEILFQYDESKSIQDLLFDATEGAFSQAGPNTGRNAFLAATSTPGHASGRFYWIISDRAKFSDWHPIEVTFEETVEAGLNDESWREKRKIQWGEKSTIYINRVLGKFVVDQADGVLPLSWIEAATQRWSPEGLIMPNGDIDLKLRRRAYGLDPADAGDDMASTCEAWTTVRGNIWIAQLDYADSDDPITTCDRIVEATHGFPGIPIGADVIGIGAAIPPYLRRQNRNPVPFISTMATTRKDRTQTLEFFNTRAWGWWMLREYISPQSETLIALPNDDRLEGDLAAPTYSERGGKILIESKEELRRADRLGHSTDGADSLIICLACDVLGAAATLDGAHVVTRKKHKPRGFRPHNFDHGRVSIDRRH